MFLSKIIDGQLLPVIEVCNYEWRMHGPMLIKFPREAKAWEIAGGAAALSQTPAGAVASAKVILEQAILRQRGDDRPCKPKYQRAHVE